MNSRTLERRVECLEAATAGAKVQVIAMGWQPPDPPGVLSTTICNVKLTQRDDESQDAFRNRAAQLALRGRPTGSAVVWADEHDLAL